MVTQIKKSKDLTLTVRLSRLTFAQAVQLLGGDDDGRKLLYAGGRITVEDIEEQVVLQGDLFRLSLPDEGVIVTITLRADQEKRLLCNCDSCDTLCEHVGAALSFILDSKTILGLAKAPDERLPVAPLSEELAMAALDYESDISEIDLQSGMDELKSRLEILLGAVPEGYLDESQKKSKREEASRLHRREKMADAGAQMMTAAFSFLTQMLPDSGATPSTEVVDAIRDQLTECAETDDQGRRSLRITLPNDDALQQFAQSLAKLISFAK